MMYEGFKICDELRPSEVCLVVEQYKDGTFKRCFHQHIRKSKLSNDARINLLKALVVRFFGGSGMGAEQIVNLYVGSRGKSRSATNLRIVTSYPEPGVLRTYCGSNTVAWTDQVIVPNKFRRN
jgi:hypothetical protein